MNTLHGNAVIECTDLPDEPSSQVIYRLTPKNADEAYYRERTDRHIGWITHDEQEMLRTSTIGIAGCGGMGGMLASTFLRLGVGEVRIADCENFDVSNINRQFGAKRGTVGLSKAFETASQSREVTDDATLVVYPQGITEATAADFVDGCDIICDEIEFWAVHARIMLHRAARERKVDILCADTVGFRSFLFLFTHESMTVEEMLRMSREEARGYQERIGNKSASPEEIRHVMEAVIRFCIPEEVIYSDTLLASCKESLRKRLFDEGRAIILATNPPMAAGFLADRVLMRLLEKRSGIKRTLVSTPPTPSYLSFDAGLMEAKVVMRSTCP